MRGSVTAAWRQVIDNYQKMTVTLTVLNILAWWAMRDERYIYLNVALLLITVPVMVYDMAYVMRRGYTWYERVNN